MNAVAMNSIPRVQSYRLSSRLTILTDGFPAPPHRMSSPLIQGVVQQAGKIILGKERQIRLALACLLASGHLLIVADEVNRATPRTQSALLEAMEEHQVTTEGETRRLPEPFFVVATQNPSHLVGTFPLPESQLDRFLMRIELGYPDRDAERTLLQGADRRDMIAGLDACLAPGDLMDLQALVKTVHAAAPLLDYIQALVEHSRRSPEYATGLSPRAALALLHASRAWALVEGRDKVLPEDVQAVLPGVAGHRLRPVHDGVRASSLDKAHGLISAVPIP